MIAIRLRDVNASPKEKTAVFTAVFFALNYLMMGESANQWNSCALLADDLL